MRDAMGTLAFSGAVSLRKLAIAGGWILLLFCGQTQADPDPSFDFKIAPQALATALVEFSQQAEVQVVGATAAIGAIRTEGVVGHFTGAEALERLLHGTELAARWKGPHTVTIAPSVKASDATATRFDLQEKDLDQVLKDFELQSGQKVVAPRDAVAGKKGRAVHGDMTANDALRRLLKGSGLTFVRGGDGSITIQPVSAAAPAGADAEGPVAADVSVQSQRVIQVYTPGGNVDIPRTIDDVQPYYIFNNETIEESGATNIEDFLKQYLTMNSVLQTNSQMYGTLNGSPMGNTSTINLRGLGANQTLILVNGHRMAGVSVEGSSGQPDINGIPIAAVDHIEVMPSSSSGIYGGSAMGGVINIILKKNYKGGDLSYTRESPVHGHGFDSTLDGSYGFSLEDGRTQAMISAHYEDSEPLLLEDRASLVTGGIRRIMQTDPGIFSSGGYNPFQGGTLTNIMNTAFTCGATGCAPQNLVLLNGTSLNAATTTLCPGISPTTPLSVLNACLLKNAGTQNLNLSPGLGEFGLQQPIGYAPRVESLIATVNRSMTSWLDAFVDITITKNDSSSQYNVIADQIWGVNAGNPTNPFQDTVAVHIPVETSVPLIADSLTRAISTGLTAQLPSGWRSEMDFTWSENSFNSYYGQVNQDLFDGVGGPGGDDSGINGALETGAVNPFVDTGAYPQNVAPYIYPWTYGSSSTLNDVALRSTGPVLQLPWGNPTVAVAVEHRQEGFPTSTQYNIYNTPTTAAFDSHTTYFGQHQSTDSLYLETNVPLVTERNALPGLRALEFQAADRIERYDVVTGTSSELVSPGGTLPISGYVLTPSVCYTPAEDTQCQIPVPRATATYKSNNHTFGLKYKPLDSVTVRGSLATAFLPPTYSQLLPTPLVTPDGDTITDPKTGATYQVNVIYGGNPNLKPESDKNWDIGVILEPQDNILKGLRVDLEYVQILRFDAIVNISGNQILSDPELASRVTRNSTTGLITQINESLINATELKYEGYDLSINYLKATDIGTFEFIGRGSIAEHNTEQLGIGGSFLELVGLIPVGQVKSTANATVTWAKGPWKLGWTTRWFDGYNSSDPDGNTLRVPAQVYHDFFAKYSVGPSSSKLLANASVQFGIKDIFNTAPPYDPYFAPFYRSPIGDIHMMEWRLGVRKSF